MFTKLVVSFLFVLYKNQGCKSPSQSKLIQVPAKKRKRVVSVHWCFAGVSLGQRQRNAEGNQCNPGGASGEGKTKHFCVSGSGDLDRWFSGSRASRLFTIYKNEGLKSRSKPPILYPFSQQKTALV